MSKKLNLLKLEDKKLCNIQTCKEKDLKLPPTKRTLKKEGGKCFCVFFFFFPLCKRLSVKISNRSVISCKNLQTFLCLDGVHAKKQNYDGEEEEEEERVVVRKDKCLASAFQHRSMSSAILFASIDAPSKPRFVNPTAYSPHSPFQP